MKEPEKVLITGASGFIGSHLVRRMVELRFNVRVLVRPSSNLSKIIGEHVEIFHGDLNDALSLDDLCKGVSKVFHLAATQHFDLSRSQFLNTNLEGTRRLVEQAIQNRVNRFVLVSSGGIHSNANGEPVREDSPVHRNNLYFESKIEAERVAQLLFRNAPERLTIIRPGAVYGPGDRRLLKLFRAVARKRFIMIGPGTTCVHPVYIDDFLDGLLLASSDLGLGDTFLLSGPEALSLNDWVFEIARAAGVTPPRWRISAASIRIIASICETLCRPFNLSPPLSHRRLGFFLNHRSYDLTKAKNQLGYKPQISVREGTQRTMESYTVEGWI